MIYLKFTRERGNDWSGNRPLGVEKYKNVGDKFVQAYETS